MRRLRTKALIAGAIVCAGLGIIMLLNSFAVSPGVYACTQAHQYRGLGG